MNFAICPHLLLLAWGIGCAVVGCAVVKRLRLGRHQEENNVPSPRMRGVHWPRIRGGLHWSGQRSGRRLGRGCRSSIPHPGRTSARTTSATTSSAAASSCPWAPSALQLRTSISSSLSTSACSLTLDSSRRRKENSRTLLEDGDLVSESKLGACGREGTGSELGACRIVAQCGVLRVSDTAHAVPGDAEISRAHLCRQRLRCIGFAQPEQAVSRAESALLPCSCAACERSASPLAPALGEDARRCAALPFRR